MKSKDRKDSKETQTRKLESTSSKTKILKWSLTEISYRIHEIKIRWYKKRKFSEQKVHRK